jgi:hypothetical protein
MSVFCYLCTPTLKSGFFALQRIGFMLNGLSIFNF